MVEASAEMMRPSRKRACSDLQGSFGKSKQQRGLVREQLPKILGRVDRGGLLQIWFGFKKKSARCFKEQKLRRMFGE